MGKHASSFHSLSVGRDLSKTYPVLTKVVLLLYSAFLLWLLLKYPAIVLQKFLNISFSNNLNRDCTNGKASSNFHYLSNYSKFSTRTFFPISHEVCSILQHTISLASLVSLSPCNECILSLSPMWSGFYHPHCLTHTCMASSWSLPVSKFDIDVVLLKCISSE